jgi:hypothetical protein
MSPSGIDAPLTVVGNPDNRRVQLFAVAARAAGLAEPGVVPWSEVAGGRPVRIEPGSLVRIDSPGEDAEVDRRLRGAPAAAAPGEIVGGAAWYAGFASGLHRVARAAADAGARLLNDPFDILTMFDKAACHARLAAAGVPVPPALPRPRSYGQLREHMRTAGWTGVFVKPVHGSSASGVVALRVSGERVRATTSVELARPALYNSLRVRTYTNPADVEYLVDALAGDGLHVERWFAKAGLHGDVVDLRVVVIAGRASHAVVRSGPGPITNLHLGNRRGDLTALRAAAGAGYAEALRTCERAAACFPGSLHVGVDLMFSPDWRQHAVAEVNAFGDLLPGLLVDGHDTYAAELRALPRFLAGPEQAVTGGQGDPGLRATPGRVAS